jgi:hypothetical protein
MMMSRMVTRNELHHSLSVYDRRNRRLSENRINSTHTLNETNGPVNELGVLSRKLSNVRKGWSSDG